MLNNSVLSNGGQSNDGSIIHSGYNVENGLSGMGELRKTFKSALELDESDFTEEAILENAQLQGKLRGYTAIAKRVIKQKQQVSNAVGQLHSLLWQHAGNAANAELGWRRTAARGLEKTSEQLLDLDIEDKSHGGFATFASKADKLIQY